MFTWNRRQLLMSGVGGLCGWLGAARASAMTATLAARARRCVVLWMEGGPSQLETFDPKPGTRTGGPVRSIATSVPGFTSANTCRSLRGTWTSSPSCAIWLRSKAITIEATTPCILDSLRYHRSRDRPSVPLSHGTLRPPRFPSTYLSAAERMGPLTWDRSMRPL